MFNWRNTFVVGVFFVLVGIIYFVTQGAGTCAPEMTHCTSRTLDLTGVLMLHPRGCLDGVRAGRARPRLPRRMRTDPVLRS